MKVSDFIKVLEKCDPDAIICNHEVEKGDFTYYEMEGYKIIKGTKYIDGCLNVREGNIINVY